MNTEPSRPSERRGRRDVVQHPVWGGRFTLTEEGGNMEDRPKQVIFTRSYYRLNGIRKKEEDSVSPCEKKNVEGSRTQNATSRTT